MDTKNQYTDRLCRTCTNEVEASLCDSNTNPQQQWQFIFDIIEECAALRIAEILSKAVPKIEVKQTDELPKKICCECLHKLLTVHRFQQMCEQSEERLREMISIKGTNLSRDAAMEIKVETSKAVSSIFKDFCAGSTHPNLQHSSVKESPEIVQPIVADHLQNNDFLPELCTDPEGDFSRLVKNEPIEDANQIEYSDSGTMNSIISVRKDEVLSIKSVHEQINVTSSPSKERENLNRHLRVREKSGHACELCGKKYSRRESLYRHARQQHKPKTKTIPCDFCDKSFNDLYRLRVHIRTHTGERPYSCPECGKSYAEKINLKRHRLASHINKKNESENRNIKKYRTSLSGDDKLYECPYCPVRFRSGSNIARHKALHEGGIKREACNICGKTYRKDALKQHKLIHNDEKAFKCDICEKRYKTKSTLKGHIRLVHSDEKPFKCKYCELSFARSNMRVLHLRTHLGDNVHRCELCPSAFRLFSELRSHITTHKNEDPETRERNLRALKEEEAKLVQNLSKDPEFKIYTEGNL